MPGFPSGRACEACRKVKKKCDEVQPTCFRCSRLGLECVGSGLRRFKFQSTSVVKDVLVTRQTNNSFQDPSPTPLNQLDILLNNFIRTIETSTDLRYNLAYTYGPFMNDLPQRLGKNAALDAAVDALVNAHQYTCIARRKEASPTALIKYSRALRTLNTSLNDSSVAAEIETLGAVMLLLICQIFLGGTKDGFSGHCEGAAKILKARGYFNPGNDFECKLLVSLRIAVLIEGLFNPKINFTADEWVRLVQNPLDDDPFAGQMIHCLTKVPVFHKKSQNIKNLAPADVLGLQTEILWNYQTMKNVCEKYQQELEEADTTCHHTPSPSSCRMWVHAQARRTYGFALSITMICISQLASVMGSWEGLTKEANDFARITLALAEQGQMCRPMGSSSNVFYLATAHIGSTDPVIKKMLVASIQDYKQDFPSLVEGSLQRQLDRIADSLRLPQPPHLARTS